MRIIFIYLFVILGTINLAFQITLKNILVKSEAG